MSACLVAAEPACCSVLTEFAGRDLPPGCHDFLALFWPQPRDRPAHEKTGRPLAVAGHPVVGLFRDWGLLL
jgi:hypothetical protein